MMLVVLVIITIIIDLTGNHATRGSSQAVGIIVVVLVSMPGYWARARIRFSGAVRRKTKSQRCSQTNLSLQRKSAA